MFLFRWRPGLEGLYVNRQPITHLPLELKPGDWWFIQDGDTYVGVRPLEATHLRGPCKTTIEERTRQIVLYQDNYVGESIDDIQDEEWVKARSGYVVELGDAAEYDSFERFRDTMLKAKVNESADGFIRHIRYERPGRRLEMKWHCYEEKYLVRRVDGRDHETLRHLRSPEFAVGTTELSTHDARLKTKAGETAWLLSAAPSKTMSPTNRSRTSSFHLPWNHPSPGWRASGSLWDDGGQPNCGWRAGIEDRRELPPLLEQCLLARENLARHWHIPSAIRNPHRRAEGHRGD